MLNCNFLVNEKFVWKLFSFFVIDENQEHNNGCCYIRFRLDDITHEMNLSQFSTSLLRGRLTFFIGIIVEFWKQITCNALAYVSRSFKATFICNPILRYLQRLMANILCLICESQEVLR